MSLTIWPVKVFFLMNFILLRALNTQILLSMDWQASHFSVHTVTKSTITHSMFHAVWLWPDPTENCHLKKMTIFGNCFEKYVKFLAIFFFYIQMAIFRRVSSPVIVIASSWMKRSTLWTFNAIITAGNKIYLRLIKEKSLHKQ